MPSVLIREGKALGGLPPFVERIRCPAHGCEMSYSFHSGESPSVYAGRGPSSDVMRDMAVAKIREAHPNHGFIYYWKGPDLGWR
jgi:hypothetical protein